MAKKALPSEPVATRRGVPGGVVIIWDHDATGGPDLSKQNVLWANGGGANPQPADGTVFAYTDDSQATVMIGSKEFLLIYVERTIGSNVLGGGNLLGKKKVFRTGWVDLAQVEHGSRGGTDAFFIKDATGKPDETAIETTEEKILRDFKAKYGSTYGTPSVIADGDTHSYKFSNGKSLHVAEWDKLTEVDRRKFVDLLPANFREGTDSDDNSSSNTLQKTLLYVLGGGIAVVLLVLLVSRLRK